MTQLFQIILILFYRCKDRKYVVPEWELQRSANGEGQVKLLS